MITTTVPEGHVRALVERPFDPNLANAAQAVIDGEDPSPHIARYNADDQNVRDGLIVEPTFGAIPIGRGTDFAPPEDPMIFLKPKERKGQKGQQRFLVNGFVKTRGRDGVPEYIIEKEGDKEEKYPIHSNPLIGELWTLPPPPASSPRPCLPTCGTSERVGDTETVRQKLGVQTLKDNRLDGAGVGLAIVDSGIFGPRIERLLGDAMEPTPTSFVLDATRSWKPLDLVTTPGRHRLGHGTMCAYDALIAAPKATLLDIPMLLARKVGDHRVTGTVDAAALAYLHLLKIWKLGPPPPFKALVVSNSWGIFHPCLEDYQPGHRFRFIDNPNHFFHWFTQALSIFGMDIVFCGNNCGNGVNCAGNCASGTCLSKTDRMIMGANAYQHVLTVGGCDTNDRWVGYSSRGRSIYGMYPEGSDAQHKPNLVAYTHFLGSRTVGTWVPDTGVSAACPVAAGCVAALRTRSKGTAVPAAMLFKTLRDTAYRPPGMPVTGWDSRYGHGVIRPVAAGRALGIIP